MIPAIVQSTRMRDSDWLPTPGDLYLVWGDGVSVNRLLHGYNVMYLVVERRIGQLWVLADELSEAMEHAGQMACGVKEE